MAFPLTQLRLTSLWLGKAAQPSPPKGDEGEKEATSYPSPLEGEGGER